ASAVRQLHSRVDWFIDASGAIAQQATAEFLQCAAHPAGAPVSKGSIDVRLLRRMGKQWSASQLLDLREMAGVIDVSVGEKNRPDVAPTEADLLDHAREPWHFAGHPRVNDYGFTARGIVQKMEIAEKPANGINPVTRIQGIESRHAPPVP